MSARNERALRSLGMPIGTASHRLRKNILFHLITKYKENLCFRCGKKIEVVDDLSIEHKQPWEGRDAKLFWDIDNIAFSHLKCNVPYIRYGGIALRKVAPEGMAWCNICKKFEPIENFHKHAGRWNGLAQHCKKYRRDRNRMPIAQACG